MEPLPRSLPEEHIPVCRNVSKRKNAGLPGSLSMGKGRPITFTSLENPTPQSASYLVLETVGDVSP